LSGGQQQRLLLARALYRQPRVLILDEGTSHLDLDRERRIVDTLKRLKITRVLIAHRTETIASAQRVISIGPSKGSASMPTRLVMRANPIHFEP
jgi:ATP-binding cassette subfamily B protein RaxB